MPRGRQGFGRSARLLVGGDFQRVFARARRSSDAYFTVLARANGDRPARLGLAVSRRQARRAVDRNRLKRLIRESFRAHRWSLHGLDLVVMNRAAAAGAENDLLLASLARHWSRLAPSAANDSPPPLA